MSESTGIGAAPIAPAAYAAREWHERSVPADPRARAVMEVLSGQSVAAVARQHGVAVELLDRWVDSFIAAGSRAVAGVATDENAPERFLTVLAHEIRTPLAAAIAGLHLLADPRLQSISQTEIHQMISERLRQLSLLCGDVLDAASVVLDKLPLDATDVDVTSIVAGAIDTHGDPRLRMLPSAPAVVRADSRRVEQIVSNMVDSALRHGLGPVRIAVSVEGHRVRMTVTDHAKTSVGAEEAMSWFEPFHSPGTTGHGLSLYVVRSLAVAHGGTAGVDSTACQEGGTNQDLHFWVTLPIEGPADRAKEAS